MILPVKEVFGSMPNNETKVNNYIEIFIPFHAEVIQWACSVLVWDCPLFNIDFRHTVMWRGLGGRGLGRFFSFYIVQPPLWSIISLQ